MQQYFYTHFQYDILGDITEANLLAIMLLVVMFYSIDCGRMLKLTAEMLICLAE